MRQLLYALDACRELANQAKKNENVHPTTKLIYLNPLSAICDTAVNEYDALLGVEHRPGESLRRRNRRRSRQLAYLNKQVKSLHKKHS